MDRRTAIRELVQETGGIHKSAISKKLGIPWGPTGFHLSKLSRNKEILLEYHDGLLWAFPPNLKLSDRQRRAKVNRGPRRRLMGIIGSRRQATIAELSAELQASRKVVRTHLSHLMRAGVVNRGGGRPHTYHLDVEE